MVLSLKIAIMTKKLSECKNIKNMEKKKEKGHEHFVNDDPTKFEHEKLEDLAKKAMKKFKSLQ